MRIYQLKTAREFYNSIKENLSIEELMSLYAEDVAKRFAAECVNEALGNKMEVSNALHDTIEKRYKSIIWEDSDINPAEDIPPAKELNVPTDEDIEKWMSKQLFNNRNWFDEATATETILWMRDEIINRNK